MTSSILEKEAIQAAREKYASDDIEIDAHPRISFGDNGAFVAAWVYVPYNDASDAPSKLHDLPEDIKTPDDVSITKYFSLIDGRVVIEIDTPEVVEDANGPIMSVWLNEGTIYDNRQEQDKS